MKITLKPISHVSNHFPLYTEKEDTMKRYAIIPAAIIVALGLIGNTEANDDVKAKQKVCMAKCDAAAKMIMPTISTMAAPRRRVVPKPHRTQNGGGNVGLSFPAISGLPP